MERIILKRLDHLKNKRANLFLKIIDAIVSIVVIVLLILIIQKKHII